MSKLLYHSLACGNLGPDKVKQGVVHVLDTTNAWKNFNDFFADWQKMGFSKGALHYMKKNAESNKPFTLNKHVRERLDQWNSVIDEAK